MPAATSIAIGAGALLGGTAGSMQDKASSSYNNKSWVEMGEASRLERDAASRSLAQFSEMSRMVDQSGGAGDARNAARAQTSLADLLAEMQNTNGLPSAGDRSAASSFANDIFAARRLGLQQSFDDQMTQANRSLAASGRSLNDPVFRAKLAQEQMRQSSMLGAEQTGYAAQLAMAMPGQRLGFAQQRAAVLNQLSQQALQNRAALLGYGQSLMQNERNWRYQTGTQRSEGQGEQRSGGGLKGALSGLLGGAASGAAVANGMGAYGGGDDGGYTQAPAPAPYAPPPPPPPQYSLMPQAYQSNAFGVGSYGAPAQTQFGGQQPYYMGRPY